MINLKSANQITRSAEITKAAVTGSLVASYWSIVLHLTQIWGHLVHEGIFSLNETDAGIPLIVKGCHSGKTVNW